MGKEIYKLSYFMDSIIVLQNLCNQKEKEKNNNWIDYAKAKEWYEGQIKNKEDELEKNKEVNTIKENEINELKRKIEEQEIQINNIYNRKMWKALDKLLKILKKK